jgi:hypothetical protein
MLDASRAELLDLDATISKVSLVPSELEYQRNLCRQSVADLQGTLSLMRRFSAEILADIFIFCRNNSLKSQTYSIADPLEVPVLLGQISSHWRSNCHGTPLLWDHVHLISDNRTPDLAYVRQILVRSHDLPLSIQLIPPPELSFPLSQSVYPVVSLFLDLRGRLKDVSLHITSSDLPPRNPHRSLLFPILASFKLRLRLSSLAVSFPTRAHVSV